MERVEKSHNFEVPEGWERFSQENHGGFRFINLYRGQFSNELILNRKVIEKFISIAGFEDEIRLINLNGQNGRGIKNGKDFDLEKNNLGWTIAIEEDLMSQGQDKNGNAKKLNKSLIGALRECLIREKLTMASYGDRLPLWGVNSHFIYGTDVISTFLWLRPHLIYTAATAYLASTDPEKLALVFSNPTVLKNIAGVWALAAFHNAARYMYSHQFKFPTRGWKEGFLPPLQIDKVVTGNVYLATVGRELVKPVK